MNFSRFYRMEANRIQKASAKFYLLSLLAYTIGSPFNMIEYINNKLWDFVFIDILGFLIIYAAFFLYLRKSITVNQNSLIYVYTLLTNLSISVWLYHYHHLDSTSNMLMNTFMFSINMVVAGLCIGRRHAFYTAGMYIILIGPLLFVTSDEYINRYAFFIIFLMIIYAVALEEFLKILERLFNEELAYKEEIFVKDKAIADHNMLILKAELEFKRRELVTKILYLSGYAENNNNLIEKLNSLRPQMNQGLQKKLYGILCNHRINHNEKYWKEFETSFIEVHHDFYQRLTEKFPNLSPSDLRLAALINLGLSSKQIADLLSNTSESVDVARSRLRNKLCIPNSANFRSYLNNLISTQNQPATVKISD